MAWENAALNRDIDILFELGWAQIEPSRYSGRVLVLRKFQSLLEQLNQDRVARFLKTDSILITSIQ